MSKTKPVLKGLGGQILDAEKGAILNDRFQTASVAISIARSGRRQVCDLVVRPERCSEPGQFGERLLPFDRAPALICEDVA